MNSMETMTFFEARKWASFAIKDNSEVTIDDIDYLMRYRFDLTPTELLLKYRHQMTTEQLAQFKQDVAQLTAGIPPQYIVKLAPFYGLTLTVNPAVLIPRMETEELIDWILTDNDENKRQVLDIGTGSGAISLALKANRPQWQVTASDISEEALAVAQTNAQNNQLAVTLINSDVFANIQGKFDIIVSNPPYIPLTEKQYMDQRVIDHEPSLALFAADNGLQIYRQIAADFAKYLTDNGQLFLEIGFRQEAAVMQIFKEAVGSEYLVSARHDLAGNQRMIKVQKRG